LDFNSIETMAANLTAAGVEEFLSEMDGSLLSEMDSCELVSAV